MTNLSKQAQEVLDVIKLHGDLGVHPTTLIFEAKVTQPNARIYDIREAFGCIHRHSDFCTATEHIINKRLSNGTTVYIYKKTPGVDWENERRDAVKKMYKEPVVSSDQLFN